MQDQMRSNLFWHCGGVCGMEAVKCAVTALTGSEKFSLLSVTEMVYQSFSTQQTDPQKPNRCIAVQIWPLHQMLRANL